MHAPEFAGGRITNLPERQGVADNDAVVTEILDVIIVDYPVAGVGVPVASPRAASALSFVSTW